jgi:hypothetical protein
METPEAPRSAGIAAAQAHAAPQRTASRPPGACANPSAKQRSLESEFAFWAVPAKFAARLSWSFAEREADSVLIPARYSSLRTLLHTFRDNANNSDQTKYSSVRSAV